MTNTTRSPDERWPFVESDRHGWPTSSTPRNETPSDFDKALDNAKLEVRKKRAEEEIARAQAERAVDNAVEQAYYSAVIDLAKGAVDRARASAETVQKAAAAIVTLYTGLLTAAFVAASHPLPFRGVFAAVLLGLAVALSTWFLAYLPDPDKPEQDPADVGPQGLSLNDQTVRTFVLWTRRSALSRGYPLRASVLALAASLFFLPAPFVQKGTTQSSTTTATWPTVPKQPQDAELKKILYTAQVTEAAEQHKAAVADEGNETFWWTAFLIALGAVFLGPLIGSLIASWWRPIGSQLLPSRPEETQPGAGG